MTLTLEFYKRNYIEGLFLSSGVMKSPDHTMEELIRVARTLRRDHGFAGYIHLKTIPEASPWLIEQAGRWADRLSINLELPTDASLARLAPEKRAPSITRRHGPDARAHHRGQGREAPLRARRPEHPGHRRRRRHHRRQTCSPTSARSTTSYELTRVYYSAFSPIPEPSVAPAAEAAAAPAREPSLPGRLADALLRLQRRRDRRRRRGRHARPRRRPQARLGAEAPRPLPGRRQPRAARAPAARPRPRRQGRRPHDLAPAATPACASTTSPASRASPRRAAPFLVTADHRAPGLDRLDLRSRLVRPPEQLALFA